VSVGSPNDPITSLARSTSSTNETKDVPTDGGGSGSGSGSDTVYLSECNLVRDGSTQVCCLRPHPKVDYKE
jgi:hypothetical protein